MGFMDVLSGAQIGGSILQSGYNLFKDITGLDYKRQLQVQKELMQDQFMYNDQFADKQQGYNVANMRLANQLSQDNMRLNHELNLQSMDKQFSDNAYLSNVGRSIIQQRQNGINPNGVGSAGGSVTALSPSGSSPGVAAPSLPSVTPGSVSPSHYSALNVDASSAYMHFMDAQKTKSEKRRVDINNQTELVRNLADLKVLISQYKKNMSESKNYDAKTDLTLKELESYEERLRVQIKSLEAKAVHDEKVGAAAESNAETAQKQQQEQARHNKAVEAIQRVQNHIQQYAAVTGRMQVNLNAEKLTSEIDYLSAMADKFGAEAMQKNLENKHWKAKILADIGLKEALTEAAKKQAEKTGKEVEWYDTKMATDIITTIMNAASNQTKAAADVIDAVVPL